jgi:hypothetical protein
MNKDKCIICEKDATRIGDINVFLEDWIGESISTGVTIGLCDEHAMRVLPGIYLDNPRIEKNYAVA